MTRSEKKREADRKRWEKLMADPVKAEAERIARRERWARRRDAMTPEEHEAKKERDRQRRREETPEQRAARLKYLRKFARSEKGLEARRRWRKKYNQTPVARARLEAFSKKMRNDPELYERVKANMRERYRKRREAEGFTIRARKLTAQEKELRKKMDWLRRQARAEARETGENIYLIFERWGCLLPKDLIKHAAATERTLTAEERLAVAFERDNEAHRLRQQRLKEFEIQVMRETPDEELTVMERAARNTARRQKALAAQGCEGSLGRKRATTEPLRSPTHGG